MTEPVTAKDILAAQAYVRQAEALASSAWHNVSFLESQLEAAKQAAELQRYRSEEAQRECRELEQRALKEADGVSRTA